MQFARRPLWAGLLSAVIALIVPAAARADAPAAQADAQKPNIIVIFCDDLGYGDLACFGSETIKTPNLDRMAREGTKFTQFYVASSVCSPSRAALLTGRYVRRTGVTGVLFPRNRNGLSPKLPTISSVLKQNGYATACIGKWHLGHLPAWQPDKHGFDLYFGIPYSNDMGTDPEAKLAPGVTLKVPPATPAAEAADPDSPAAKKAAADRANRGIPGPPLMRGDAVIEHPADQSTLTKRYTEEAVKFIGQNKDKPFLLYLPHTMPHVPLAVTPEFKGKSKGGLYGDTIEELDWSVGQVLDAVRDLNLQDRTLVVFTSDNGPWLSKKDHGGSAGPLRDGKFSVYEGGFRVPTIFWWPGRVPAGRTQPEVAATIDLLPTVSLLAGSAVPEGVDGKDIRPLMFGESGAKTPHDVYYYDGRAVRKGSWKLVKQKGTELFNLDTDPGEKTNLADQKPEIVKELESLLQAWKQDPKAGGKK